MPRKYINVSSIQVWLNMNNLYVYSQTLNKKNPGEGRSNENKIKSKVLFKYITGGKTIV